MTDTSSATSRILLIEDNLGDARLIAEMLADVRSHTAFQVVHVARLDEGLTRLDVPGVDIVLLDLSLPDSRGLETCQRVLARAPWAPIVVLSGLDDEQLAVEAVHAGAQDYLVKGHVDGNLLVRALRYAIERKGADEERLHLLERERFARAEAERLAAERRATLHYIADGVITADRDCTITYANPAALQLHGVAQLSWPRIGPDVPYALLTPAGKPFGSDDLPLARAALHGETVVNTDMRIRRADGSEVTVQGSAAPIVTEDGVRIGAVLTLHDVTAQRQLERHKDEFLTNVSHDLRTPLAAIKASIGAVLANEPAHTSAPIHRLLSNIDVATDRMTALVDDLLELTRLRAGRVRLRRQRCDVRALTRRCVQAMEPLAAARGQRVLVSVPRRPVWAFVDAARLERALLNLLANAQKYGGEHATTRVRVESRGDHYSIAVADDGPGIPESEQSRIFERFFRGEAEAASPNQGSGLGLPIARAMVELHGGRLWVESSVGAGSTFFIALPSATPEQAREAAPAPQEGSSKGNVP